MPYPLPKNHNFSITYLETSSTHHMPVMGAAFDFYEISFLITGNRKSVTPDAIYFMNPGSVTLTPPDLYHQTKSISDDCYSRILIKFTLPIAEYIEKIIGTDTFHNLCSEHIFYFNASDQERIQRMFSEMLEEYELGSSISEELLTGMLLRLISSINRWKINNVHQEIDFKKENPIILKAINYLTSDPKNSPSMVDTAAFVGLAPAYFSRLFKQVTGYTFSQYVTVFKLLYARTLLMQTNLTLSDIAMTVGYTNGNYLSNQFHKHFHMTPTEYKRKYAGSDQYPDCF